jgi:hypothetical protein
MMAAMPVPTTAIWGASIFWADSVASVLACFPYHFLPPVDIALEATVNLRGTTECSVQQALLLSKRTLKPNVIENC